MTEPKKILIVDDDPEMLEELQEILEDEGYSVVVALGGVEATKKFKCIGQEIALVLLDIKMPEMNGIKVYRTVREINKNIPIIIVTGSFVKENADQLIQEGADAVIYKPFEVSKLLTLIQQKIA